MTDAPNLIRSLSDDGILTLTLNRGPVNALSAPFLMELAETFESVGSDKAVRAVVVNSAFKVFSAGLDLKEAQGFDHEQQAAIVHGLNVGFLAQFACPKPVVAAVGGAAIAGGLFFVLAADLRVASPKARLGLAEVRVGVDFPVGPMEIARATLDPNALRRLMLTGQPMDAATAHQSGIIDHLCDPDDLMETAIEQARVLAGSPSGAYAAVKHQIRGDVIAQIEQAVANPASRPEGGWYTDETRDAMQRMIG